MKKRLIIGIKRSLNDTTKDASKSVLKKRSFTCHINQSAQKKVAIDSNVTLVQHRLLTSLDESRSESFQSTNKKTCVVMKSTYDQNIKQNANLETLMNSEFFNSFDTNDLNHSENIFTAESNITLNDAEMSDSQSEDSMKFFEKYVSDYSDDVNTSIMSARSVKINISNFCLALRL